MNTVTYIGCGETYYTSHLTALQVLNNNANDIAWVLVAAMVFVTAIVYITRIAVPFCPCGGEITAVTAEKTE